MLTSLVALAPAASAHFERGANCHIERVRQNGNVRIRLSNRASTAATIECGLKTYGGTARTRQWYVSKYIAGRHYVTRKWFFPGNWASIRINHVHRV
jgi:hypothetical protein